MYKKIKYQIMLSAVIYVCQEIQQALTEMLVGISRVPYQNL